MKERKRTITYKQQQQQQQRNIQTIQNKTNQLTRRNNF